MKWIKTFESVSSQKNLEKLSSDILKKMANRTMKFNIIKKDDIQYLDMINGAYLPNLDITKYNDELKQFITETKLGIVPIKKLQSSAKGVTAEGAFNESSSKIYLNVKESLIEEINEKLVNPPKYNEHTLYLTEDDLYFKFWYAFNTILLHELQHAWDAWKSKGKYTNSKKWNKYKKDIHKYNTDISQNSLKGKNLFNNYLKLPHEINARFTQAIDKTRFWGVESKPPFNQFKKPFDTIKRDFITNYEGWNKMSPSIQKRLLHRLYQFWSSDYKKREEKDEN